MQNTTIIISNARYAEIIRTDEIAFCKAAGSYTEVVFSNKQKITASKNLHWFEERCNTYAFCRIHKSFLVNLNFINKVFHLENNLLLTNGIRIPISKSKKNVLWDKLEQMNHHI